MGIIDFFEFEVAAVALNGCNNVLTRNLNITKSTGNIRLLSTYSQGRFIRNHLKRVIEREKSEKFESTFNGQSGQDILNKLESKDVDLASSIEDYKRLIQLNNHIDGLFKKKVREISATKKEIKKND